MLRALSLASIAAAALAASAAVAQEDAPEFEYETTELSGGIVMLSTGRAGNVAILPGPDGVFVVDDQLPETGSALEAAIEAVAGEGVPRFILSTHWHADHVGGNSHFAAQGSTVAGHHNIRARILASEEDWAMEPGAAPILTFGDDLHFHVNGQTVRATHVPAAHTDGDALVYFEEADVLHMGDVLFSGLFPYIDLDSGGSVEGYIEAMRVGLEIAGPETEIIAGHGPLSTEADLVDSIAMLTEARSRVEALVAEGADLDAVMEANPLADFHDDWNWGFITTERMTETLYRDVTAQTE
ncbi:MBL fold metallo-hydrolase [Marinicauda salina]|uniref:beta-lactamase n=1 Tax=Marinicauda salina TaxID=2135793 RepID=A0A2U2BWA8_9PROT|nr:MBL fold metallo-hydrolase [Marinicauda salina]PWE18301.1 MBL fold metallo-hydrolase [Marinicauda salina]